jgi:hypothetical protein
METWRGEKRAYFLLSLDECAFVGIDGRVCLDRLVWRLDHSDVLCDTIRHEKEKEKEKAV